MAMHYYEMKIILQVGDLLAETSLHHTRLVS